MKKLGYLLFIFLPIFTACSSTVNYIPAAGGTSQYVPPEKKFDTTYDFYLSYSHTHSDDPDVDPVLISVPWYQLTPLGSVPEAINTEEKILALAEQKGFIIDPAFPKFIGFSAFGVCLRDEDLWNFETDYRQQAATSIYGIWVAED